MTKLSLNRIHSIEDCALFQETLRQQQTSLTIKIDSLQRRIERYREIIEQTTGELRVKQTVLDTCERLVTQAPPTDIKIRRKRELAESRVLVLKARLLRYSPVGLLNLESRLQIAENAVELIGANLLELSACQMQFIEEAASIAVSQLPAEPIQPDLPALAPVQMEPANAPVNEKAGELAVVVLSEKPFLTLKSDKQPPLPEIKNEAVPGASKRRSKSTRRPPSARN